MTLFAWLGGGGGEEIDSGKWSTSHDMAESKQFPVLLWSAMQSSMQSRPSSRSLILSPVETRRGRPTLGCFVFFFKCRSLQRSFGWEVCPLFQGELKKKTRIPTMTGLGRKGAVGDLYACPDKPTILSAAKPLGSMDACFVFFFPNPPYLSSREHNDSPVSTDNIPFDYK